MRAILVIILIVIAILILIYACIARLFQSTLWEALRWICQNWAVLYFWKILIYSLVFFWAIMILCYYIYINLKFCKLTFFILSQFHLGVYKSSISDNLLLLVLSLILFALVTDEIFKELQSLSLWFSLISYYSIILSSVVLNFSIGDTIVFIISKPLNLWMLGLDILIWGELKHELLI